jgi:hypothetical protein
VILEFEFFGYLPILTKIAGLFQNFQGNNFSTVNCYVSIDILYDTCSIIIRGEHVQIFVKSSIATLQLEGTYFCNCIYAAFSRNNALQLNIHLPIIVNVFSSPHLIKRSFAPSLHVSTFAIGCGSVD